MAHSVYRNLVIMLSILCLLQGCYGYRVQVKHPDPVTEPETEMVHSLFWGLMVSPQAVVAENCRSNALDEVYVQSNFGYSLLTVITLGIWSPMEIDWRCAEKLSNDGDDDGMI